MGVQPSDQIATAEPGTPGTAGRRKLLLDEMVAERERPPLPPEPVLSVEPAPVDAAPMGAGRRGARKRVAELEALARRNLRAAEEARRVMRDERRLLEEEASARTHAERAATALQRELERLRSTEEQRAAQARFAADREARSELASEIERVHQEHTRVVDELDRLRGTLFDHDSLLDEYSQRLHEEQRAQSTARAELVRAQEAERIAERNLEIATESARRRAEDDLTRITKTEEALHDTRIERDRAVAELRALTTGDGEIARLRTEIAAAREDATQLMSDLDSQAARADRAESELSTAREACAQAERVAAEAVSTRDDALASLEQTRVELAQRTEALETEKSTSQATIAELRAQLVVVTRTAESATVRVADLEEQLASVTAGRDDAIARIDELGRELDHARSDADQLRVHAASIGDELAATQHALDEARRPVLQVVPAALEPEPLLAATLSEPETSVVEALVPSAEAAAAPEIVESLPEPVAAAVVEPVREPVAAEGAAGPETSVVEPLAASAEAAPAPAEPVHEPSPFDLALASAFGEAIPAKVEPARERPRVRKGGPIVEREAALVRELIPAAEPASAEVVAAAPTPERPPEVEGLRRTAMAELTALATDSDDLTPRRRR